MTGNLDQSFDLAPSNRPTLKDSNGTSGAKELLGLYRRKGKVLPNRQAFIRPKPIQAEGTGWTHSYAMTASETHLFKVGVRHGERIFLSKIQNLSGAFGNTTPIAAAFFFIHNNLNHVNVRLNGGLRRPW
jgi:hypothetical protein